MSTGAGIAVIAPWVCVIVAMRSNSVTGTGFTFVLIAAVIATAVIAAGASP